MTSSNDHFPFRSSFSLEHLFAFWRSVGQETESPRAVVARQIQDRLDDMPALAAPLEDLSVLEDHRDLLDLMMVAVFPAALLDKVVMSVTAPFQMQAVYSSPAFDRLQLFERGCPQFMQRSNFDERILANKRTMYAYYWILSELYGIELPPSHPMVLWLNEEETGLDRYFKIHINTQFASIKTLGPLPKLSDAVIEQLLSEPENLALWMKMLPPELFEFQGFVVMTATDVTEQAVLSELKDDLLRRGAMASAAQVQHLQHRLRNLLRQPDLELGLICLQQDDVDQITGARAIGRSLLIGEAGAPQCPHRGESFYAHTYARKEPLIVNDLTECSVCTGFEEHLKGLGYRTLLLAPLRLEGQLIGILELASPRPGVINAFTSVQLTEAIALFATAMKRSLDELEDQIQAVIKQQYTAIHPTVEWKFHQVAMRYLERQQAGDRNARIEEVVFDNVYPLYGLTDVRHSSTHRNTAIQADLLAQLSLAHDVVVEASIARPMPFLDELSFRITRYADRLEPGASTEDETSVLAFLRTQVEHRFDELAAFGPRVQERIQHYQDALDPDLQIVYKQRKDFEESIRLVNETVSGYLLEKDEQAQATFPHYFELFMTDGVDYNVYIGDALAERRSFNKMYLDNIRLWQLMTMCGIEWTLSERQPTLPMPLDATHLILVQSTPLGIRFRMEEKQFDVDGAYNIRYEIVKKRIDKAVIKGTTERLTQPGQIAIVYSQAQEAADYERYLDYLRAAGYITGQTESYELEPMQGVHGLKALRVTVSETPPESSLEIAPSPDLIASRATVAV